MKRTPTGLVRLCLFTSLALQPLAALGTTYVPMNDAALVDQAPAIVLARVLSSEAVAAENSTLTTVAVSRVLKGGALPSRLVVRVPGFVAAREALLVPGAPRFSPGERVLLFLAPRPDGSFGVAQFLLGAFHEVRSGEERWAVRDLAGATSLAFGAAASAEPARDLERFADWIAARAAGVRPAIGYTTSRQPPPLRSLPSDFVLLGQARWQVFDSAGSVPWQFHSAGYDGSGGGAAGFATARAAWNSDANSAVNYSSGGNSASAGQGLAGEDGANRIIFGDPNNEISGSFVCGNGGVLAIGGYRTSGSHSHNSQSFGSIDETDIVVQDGTGCFFAGNPGSDADVFTHELGHTLGLGHSPDGSAIMFASAQPPYQAVLGDDDRAGICFLYGSNCPGGPTLPAAPTNLAASPTSSSQIALSWSDNSSNESTFRVEARLVGGVFTEIGSVGANATGANVSGLAAGTTYEFRVRARNSAGNSAYSNAASATTLGAGSPPAAPSTLTASALSSSAIRLTWQDNSTNETSFRIERLVSGIWSDIGGVGANVTAVDVIGLSPSTSYTLRVKARNAAGDSAPSNQASATTHPAAVTPPLPPVNLQAAAGSTSLINLSWIDAASNEDSYRIEMRTGGAAFVEVTTTGANATAVSIDGLQPGTTYDFQVRARNAAGDSAYSNVASATTAASCGAGPDAICLNGGRFAASITWRTPDGSQGVGHPVRLSAESAYFWFFAPNNIETVVKVLDGCGLTNAYWVFATGLTNVEVVLTVKDSLTQQVKTYTNAQNTPFAPLQDIGAFATCNAAAAPATPVVDLSSLPLPSAPNPAVSAAACAPETHALCLQGGRFRVAATWRTASGASGQGTAQPLTSDSGTFWFFSESNVELIVKVLDACGFADRFWVFAGGLTNVEVTLTVTDTASGEVRTYTNPLNQPYLPLQDGNAFDTCP